MRSIPQVLQSCLASRLAPWSPSIRKDGSRVTIELAGASDGPLSGQINLSKVHDVRTARMIAESIERQAIYRLSSGPTTPQLGS
jgi:hypothetical protein